MKTTTMPAAPLALRDVSAAPRLVILDPGDAPPAFAPLAPVLRARGYETVLAEVVPSDEDRQAPAIVLLPWARSDATRCGLLQQIRSSEPDCRSYVIALVPEGDAAVVEQVISLGADDVLCGPVDPSLLFTRVRVAERLVRLQSALARKNRRLSESNEDLERINRKAHRQLQAAARVQQSLLPRRHWSIPGYCCGWRLRPCDELAGDILSFKTLDEHHLAFYVLDVSGHGVSAALLSVQVARLITPVMSESNLLKKPLSEPPWYRVVPPAEVVAQLNETFAMDSDIAQYFTILYGTLHLGSGRLQFASAGHPGPIHVPAGGRARAVPARGLPVGIKEQATFEEHQLVLAPGDRIWLFSDGIVEAEDPGGRSIGLDRLCGHITGAAGVPVQQAADRVMSAVEQWSLPATPGDDCSVLAVERAASATGEGD